MHTCIWRHTSICLLPHTHSLKHTYAQFNSLFESTSHITNKSDSRGETQPVTLIALHSKQGCLSQLRWSRIFLCCLDFIGRPVSCNTLIVSLWTCPRLISGSPTYLQNLACRGWYLISLSENAMSTYRSKSKPSSGINTYLWSLSKNTTSGVLGMLQNRSWELLNQYNQYKPI